MNKTIGIIGGMGPLATEDLFHKIVALTDAGNDQEHARVVIDSNTEIADRTEAILHGGKDPLPEMVKSAVRLQGMGADVLIMPCNTAHFFYEKLLPYINIPLLNMLEETAAEVKRQGIRKVGLLATDGTIETGVYKKVFDKYQIEMMTPSKENQNAVMDIIYQGVKANNFHLDTSGFERAMDELLDAGAEVLILGCTELPVAFERFGFQKPNIDPTRVLAKSAIRFVGLNIKE